MEIVPGFCVAGYPIIGAAVIHSVPPDISILALALAAVTILVAVRQTVAATTVIRIAAYLAAIPSMLATGAPSRHGSTG